jgi:hypothetical protein
VQNLSIHLSFVDLFELAIKFIPLALCAGLLQILSSEASIHKNKHA